MVLLTVLALTVKHKLTIEGKYLKKVVLHDVPDDPKLVEVSTSSLRPKRLLERDRDAGNGVPVPRGAEDHVGEAQRYQVLDHLLA